jgi:hypothetical protein
MNKQSIDEPRSDEQHDADCKVIEDAYYRLVDRLQAKGLDLYDIARVIAFHNTGLYTEATDNNETVALCQHLAGLAARDEAVAPPSSDAQH